MTKQPMQGDLYKVDDIVILHKQKYVIVRVYYKQRAYKVVPLMRDENAAWDSFYPEHGEISGLADDYYPCRKHHAICEMAAQSGSCLAVGGVCIHTSILEAKEAE